MSLDASTKPREASWRVAIPTEGTLVVERYWLWHRTKEQRDAAAGQRPQTGHTSDLEYRGQPEKFGIDSRWQRAAENWAYTAPIGSCSKPQPAQKWPSAQEEGARI